MAKIKIYCDAFDICNRIKNLDSGYFVVYETNKKRFEIHNKNQLVDTFCITVDGELDCRVIYKLRKTSRENAMQLLEEMEKSNAKIEAEKTRKLKDETIWKAGEMFDYANSKTTDTNFDKAYKTTWV